MIDTKTIYEGSDAVIKEVTTPVHAIYYITDRWGYAEMETADGYHVAYFCDSEADFDKSVEMFAAGRKHDIPCVPCVPEVW